MRRIFIDLGSYNGDTLELAVKAIPDFDEFIGFEPIKSLNDKAIIKLADYPKVKLFNVAAGLEDKEIDFYVDTQKGKTSYRGSTMMSDKITGILVKSKVKSINFPKWLVENVNQEDFVILKVDIEGFEYPLLEKLIQEDIINLIDIIYIEWHWKKIASITETRHNDLIAHLNVRGIEVNKQFDELVKRSLINADGTKRGE